jgi:RimJ/RimL family protein N-acetyltransferase
MSKRRAARFVPEVSFGRALYEIETERLLLHQWRDGDWDGLLRTYGDPEVMSWLGATAADLPSTAAAIGRMSMHWRLLGYGMFAVEERSSGEIVGRVGLTLHPDWPLDGPKVEVGWTLQRSAWGKGTRRKVPSGALSSHSTSWACRRFSA